jgi:hypothetical protein
MQKFVYYLLRQVPDLPARYIDTATFQLFPAQGADFTDTSQTLEYVNFAASTGFGDRVNITGKMPAGYDAAGSRKVSVLVSQSLADRLKLAVGQSYGRLHRVEERPFSVPLLVMILIFIGLVVDMVVAQRRNEIAVLRSLQTNHLPPFTSSCSWRLPRPAQQSARG